MDDILDEIELPEIPELEEEIPDEDEVENGNAQRERLKEMKPIQKELEVLYTQFEKMKTEAKKYQDLAKEYKDAIVSTMTENGYDEIVVNGLDNLVTLSITYPEHEVLNKKSLAEALGIKQKELSKPEVIINLTKDGKITEEMIVEYTMLEERMLFSASEYHEGDGV